MAGETWTANTRYLDRRELGLKPPVPGKKLRLKGASGSTVRVRKLDRLRSDAPPPVGTQE